MEETGKVIDISPAVEEVTLLALPIPQQAKAITIKSMDDYIKAGEIILTIKAIRKKITDTFKPIKQKLDAAKAEVLAQEKAADAPLREAEAWLSPQIVSWDREQERIRREEERRLQEEARKQEEERRLQEALAAEASGDKAIIEEKPYIPSVVLPKATPKIAGMSIRENWRFYIIDEKLIPREYLKIDEVKIGVVVRTLKDKTNIPGIGVYSDGSVVRRK